MGRKKEIILLVGLVILATAFRIFMPSVIPVAPDSVLYLKLSDSIKFGSLVLDIPNKMQSLIQPGYSLVIFLFNLIINNAKKSGLIVSIISGVLLVLVVYYLGKRLFGRKTGLISAIMVATFPIFINFSTRILTESLFTLLFCSAVLFFWNILKGRFSYFRYFLLGILVGYAYLVRLAGLSLLGFIITWIIIYWLYQKKLNKRQVLGSLVMVFLGFSLVGGSYMLYLYQEKGTFVLTGMQDYAVAGRAKFNYQANNLQEEKYRVYNALTEDKKDYLGNQFGLENKKFSIIVLANEYWKGFKNNIAGHLKRSLFVFFIEILFLFYALAVYRKRRFSRESFWYVLSLIPFFLFLYWQGRFVLRYYYPIMPLLIILMSLGIVSLKLNRKNMFSYLTLGFFFLALYFLHLLNFYVIDPVTVVIRPYFAVEDRTSEIAKFIKDNYPSGISILSSSPILSYYAGAKNYPLPYADAESIIFFCKFHKIGLIMIKFKENDQTSTRYLLASELREISASASNQGVREIIWSGGFSLFEVKY